MKCSWFLVKAENEPTSLVSDVIDSIKKHIERYPFDVHVGAKHGTISNGILLNIEINNISILNKDNERHENYLEFMKQLSLNSRCSHRRV